MKTYLSIDIDFWNQQTWVTDTRPARRRLEEIFREAKRRHIPINAVMNHQQLTPYVDASNANELINIDTHSDLGDVEVDTFSCGSWVSYIRWRHRGTYTWYHRLGVDVGECNDTSFGEDTCKGPIFSETDEPAVEKTDWKELRRFQVYRLPKTSVLLKNCVEIGFVMSPTYSDDDLVLLFRKLVKEFNLPYKRGIMEEDKRTATRRPPFRKRKAA